jgi:hypothetical protein
MPLAALASVNQTDRFQAVAASQPIDLEGTLANPVWKTGLVAKDFYNLTTRRPVNPDVATTAYLLYDGTYIYAGFECTQSSVAISATQTTNGVGMDSDDQVEVDIDTSGNGSRTYTFKTTPRGVRYQSSTESQRFNPPWRAAGSIAGRVWYAEMAIPLRDLRSGAAPWRINLQRRIAATNETFSWVYEPLMLGPNDSRYWPELDGMHLPGDSTRPLPHADVYGLASIGADRNQFQQTNGAFAFQKARSLGGDLTYPFTSTLALVGTASPDFSNVELDQQTIAPQQFQRTLLEYRPFFAQGAEYLIPGKHFNVTGLNDEIFYSPSIGTFNSGEKIEGTVRSNAVGFLDTRGPGFDDQAFGYSFRTPAQDFNYFVDGVDAHHSQDGSSVTACPGIELACRDSTYEVGLKKQNLASGFFSYFDYAGESGDFVADRSLAHDFRATIARERQYANLYVWDDDIGPYYAPVDGFTLISDIRGPGIFAEFNAYGKPGAAVKTWYGYVGGNRDLDRSGHVGFAQTYADLKLTLKNRLTFEVNPLFNEQRTSNGYPLYTNAQTLPYDQTYVKAGYALGSASPATASYSWGPFAALCSAPPEETTPNALFCGPYPNLYANFYLQQFASSLVRQLSTRFNVSVELDGSDERPFLGPSDGQWLRRISLGESLSRTATISLGLRSITGTGGFAEPGVNFAASFHDQFPTGDELFVAFGSPASSITLNKVIVKYIVHIGHGGVGT